MKNSMKKSVVIVLLALGLSHTAMAANHEEIFTSGREWSREMSRREKFISLTAPALLFERYDVHLRHALPQYVSWIDTILARNPRLENEDVGNIFASTVYLFEPENRLALKTMEMNFLRGDMENNTLYPPRLSIEDTPEEIRD